MLKDQKSRLNRGQQTKKSPMAKKDHFKCTYMSGKNSVLNQTRQKNGNENFASKNNTSKFFYRQAVVNFSYFLQNVLNFY